MNGDLVPEVKAMFYEVCKGDHALATIIGDRIYTFVKQGAVYPYIRICNISTSDGGTKTSPGQSITVSVDIFSQEKSDLHIDLIKQALTRLFHERQPPIEGGVVSNSRFLSATYQPADGTTRHCVARFRLTVYEDNPS